MLNVCGLKSKLLSDDFENFIDKYDIVGLSETKLDQLDSMENCLNEFYGFFSHRKCSKRASGGVGLLVKRSLSKFVKQIDIERDYLSWFEIDEHVFGREIILGIVYVPPEASRYSNIDMFDEIESDLIQLYRENTSVCIMGDFNARTGTQSDVIYFDEDIIDLNNDFIQKQVEDEQTLLELGYSLKRVSTDCHMNNYGSRLLQLCKSMGLMIANGRCGIDSMKGETTCSNVSVVDYVIGSPDILCHIVNFEVMPFCNLLSDKHNPVSFSVRKLRDQVKHPIKNNDYGSTGVSCPQENVNTCVGIEMFNNDNNNTRTVHWSSDKKEDFVKNIDTSAVKDIEQFLDQLQAMSNMDICQDNIDTVMNMIGEVFCVSADVCKMFKQKCPRYICKKTKRKFDNKPWFNDDCEKQRKRLFAAKNVAKNKRIKDSHEVKLESKLYKSKLKKSRRLYFKNINKKLKKMSIADPQGFWNMLKSKSKKDVESPNLESFMEHFKSLNEGPVIHTEEESELKNCSTVVNDELNMPITLNEIQQCITQLKNNKACGEDMIKNEFLKSTFHIFSKLYVRFFNIILDTGIVPHKWLEGIIIPLYKNKGDRKIVDNYRGITILSCFGKLFTSIINQRLTKYVNDYNIIGPEQAGFRKDYSTLDHILTFKLLLDFYLGQRKKLFCAFIDYRKAFDSVDRVNLWKKLLSNNINGKLFNVVFNMYKQAKSCVKLNGIKSSYFNCLAGVRQGENLSPLLFAIFLSDLEMFLYKKYDGLPELRESVYKLLESDDTVMYLNIFVLLYADDTIILAESKDQLQRALVGMKEYCDTWGLQINSTKTKVMVFSRGKIKNKPVIYYGDQTLEVVFNYTYLGIVFNYNGSFNLAIKRLYDIGCRAMFEILKKGRIMCLDIDTQLRLFDAMVIPIILYGCEIWGFSNLNLIEKLHLKFCKIILKVKRCTSSNMVYGELGRLPLSCIVKSRAVTFWNKIVVKDSPKLSTIIYKLMLALHKDELVKCNWMHFIESTLNELGIGYIWLNQCDSINYTWLKNIVTQTLSDQRKQEWNSDVNSSSSCINYRLFKNELCYEKYLNILSPNLRIAYTRFRCRNISKLPVVYGSYMSIPLDQRKCEKCDKNAIGDEFHYILECDYYKEKRKLLIKKYYYQNPSTVKFKLLFQAKGKELINLSKLVLFITRTL